MFAVEYEDDEEKRMAMLKAVKHISCDPGTKYSTNFKQRNACEVRRLETKGTHVSVLNWQTALRPGNEKMELVKTVRLPI
jgi:hypothetical protein